MADVLVVLEDVAGAELGGALGVVVVNDELAVAVELDEVPPPQPAAPRTSAAQIAASAEREPELIGPV